MTVDFTDPSWVQARLVGDQRSVASAALEPVEAPGMSADVQRLVVAFEDGSRSTFVLKRTKASSLEKSVRLGLAREALFYQRYHDLGAAAAGVDISSLLPRVLYSEGSMELGTKAILMEDLTDAAQTGLFFGPGNPNNWGKDLEALTAGRGFDTVWLSVARISSMAFSTAARLHARFWQQEGLSGVEWLRGSGWITGTDKESWLASQKQIADAWSASKPKMNDGEVQWDPLVVACVDASIRRASSEADGWETFQRELKARPFTLVQGDFHPANHMVRAGAGAGAAAAGDAETDATSGKAGLVLLDWEVVGVGSGPQELGQYMISHTDPAIRVQIERGAVEAYYAELTGLNSAVAASMSWEDCWKEYVEGGVGRWMWMLPLLTSVCPPQMVQFFHDQVKAFLETHGICVDNVPLPRA